MFAPRREHNPHGGDPWRAPHQNAKIRRAVVKQLLARSIAAPIAKQRQLGRKSHANAVTPDARAHLIPRRRSEALAIRRLRPGLKPWEQQLRNQRQVPRQSGENEATHGFLHPCAVRHGLGGRLVKSRDQELGSKFARMPAASCSLLVFFYPFAAAKRLFTSAQFTTFHQADK